ncbi:squalene synthase HpnC [Variovorax sp. J22R133]|uniref:squalene synthase HpnC n=1 Tax=Variovorax brevis TaxID=3053503 RepID=UPI002578B3A1|nr:squalene synthase HpnC [Variovorax sp. J22R133]MDM0112568.1 squalene synthase HpnC [Variovorax sp. J22R133]
MPAPSPTIAPPPESQTAGRHYENFPVASWLCPPHLRPPIAAIYAFARTADDIADEGDASPKQRLKQLRAFRADLKLAARGQPTSSVWPGVFEPLARQMARFALPESLLADLLSAFMQDIEKTRDGTGYADRDDLLDYCSRSANPVGRLMLHLYEVDDERSVAQSDAICTALQLINFWQDLSVDLPRGRYYLPHADCAAHGLSPEQFEQFRPLGTARPPQAAIALVADEVKWARTLMMSGAQLVHTLPGRAGWELRLVVQGGLRILDKIEAQGFDSFSRRPTVKALDAGTLAWKAMWMRRQSLP